jgi:DNA-binding transcriptional MerR regulator
MSRSACWSYVTWHHQCSRRDWATWEPGEVVELGDVGRFDEHRCFVHFENIRDPQYGIDFKPSRPKPVAPRHYWAGKYFRVKSEVMGNSGPLSANVKIIAQRKHACILELNEATETRIRDEHAVMQRIAGLVRDQKWELDLVVVAGRIKARQGFAAISQAAGQTLELKATGDAGLRGILDAQGPGSILDISAQLHLAAGRGATGYLIYEFGSRETPIFTHAIRVKRSLWSRLLPWQSEQPWLIDPAGGRRNLDKLVGNLSHLPPEARRYDPDHSEVTLSEFSDIAVEDLFEEVSLALPVVPADQVGPSRRKPGRIPSPSASDPGAHGEGYRASAARAVAGITYSQLDYWARTGLVEPSVRGAHGPGSKRLYSFRDVLILKIVKRLLDTGISLQQIRAAVHHLKDRGDADLAQVTLMSDGVSVYECTSPDEVVDLLAGGQGVYGVAMGRVWQEVAGELAELPGGLVGDRLIDDHAIRHRLDRGSTEEIA